MICSRRTTTAALALIGLLAFGGNLQAQGLTIGFKLGPTFADLEFDDETIDGNRINNFGGGGFIRFGLGGLALQPEVLVFTKGSDIDADDVQNKLDYLEVPVLLHFSLGAAGISPFLAVGPSFGFELSCKEEDDVAGSDTDCDTGTTLPDRKSFDLGLTGVAGLEFRLGPGALLVEGRYIHGLSNISEESGTKVKNRAYAIMAGYSISLGR